MTARSLTAVTVIAIAALTSCSSDEGTTAASGWAGAGGVTGAAGTTTGGQPGGSAGGGQSELWVSGYYPGYQRDLYPPEEIDFSAITHLFVGRVTPNQDGSLNTTFDIDAKSGPEMAKQLTARAHQAGRKAVLMIGGAGEHGGWVNAASEANRATFVNNLVAFASEHGFDGFDLDWEPIYESDQPLLRAVAEELRAVNSEFILTLPVGWINANFPSIDRFYSQIAPLLDQINIMSYGMAGTWSGWQSWHSSALAGHGSTTPSSIESNVQAFIDAGVPADKLGIGIGFYGSCWSPPVTGPRQKPSGASIIASDNVMSYRNIMDSYFASTNRHWDEAAKVPYLSFDSATGPQGCTFVSYDDAQSILAKGAYVRQAGLGGTIIWTINQGHLPDQPVGQRDPLLDSVKKAFLD